jgi:hypothetical protein
MAIVARRPFRTADALIVVSSDGYFDVFPPTDRRPNDKPAYRGVVAELGGTVRGEDGRLGVRPDSVALDAAVSVWSRSHGAAAVHGDMGLGRNDSNAKAPVKGAAGGAKSAPEDAEAAPAKAKKATPAGKAS